MLAADVTASLARPAHRAGNVGALLVARAASGRFNVAAHGLRGLASLFVLVAHIAGGTAKHVYPDNAEYVNLIRHPWLLGIFGVEIFFVISGYVILPSAMKYSLREFALRRTVRIYPLFLAATLLFAALNLATNAFPHVNDALSAGAALLFVNLLTGTEQLAPNAWSLSYEAMFYVATGLLVAFAIKRRIAWPGAIAIAAALAFVAAFPITVFFLIGAGVRLLLPIERAATRLTRLLEIAGAGALIWYASRAHFDYADWRQFGDPLVPPILASTALYMATALLPDSLTARALGGPAFRYAGEVSYSLYLVHPFVYLALRKIFVAMGWFTEDVAASMLLFAAAVIALSLLATHVVHRWIERWPYQAIFGQRVYHARPQAGA